MRAKRTFLEFIVGEHVGDDSIRCKFCGKIYKTGGIRNHLTRKNPEEWEKIRPYNDVILQYLEIKNQNGLTAEEWEHKLLEEYKKALVYVTKYYGDKKEEVCGRYLRLSLVQTRPSASRIKLIPVSFPCYAVFLDVFRNCVVNLFIHVSLLKGSVATFMPKEAFEGF